MKYLAFLCLVLLTNSFLAAQSKTYVYYLNDQMEIVPKDQAQYIGRGYQKDTFYMMQLYRLNEKLPFQFDMYKDSTLNELNGSHIVYYENRKVAEKSRYYNNALHGPLQKFDSTGRLTDSMFFFQDKPFYVVKYTYLQDGSREKKYEFKNSTPISKFPNDNDKIISIDGTTINTALWKSLIGTHRYSLMKDKIDQNLYLIFKYNDEYYNQMLENSSKPQESSYFKTGQDFNLNVSDINGNKLQSKELKGKILVINFWFINCPPCRQEIPELNQLVQDYKDAENVKFIGIALDDRFEIKDFLQKFPFHYQQVANGRTTAQLYGVEAFPTHVIVDAYGKVYFHTTGSPFQLFRWMRITIDELLAKKG